MAASWSVLGWYVPDTPHWSAIRGRTTSSFSSACRDR
jgi:hypothetical protein